MRCSNTIKLYYKGGKLICGKNQIHFTYSERILISRSEMCKQPELWKACGSTLRNLDEERTAGGGSQVAVRTQGDKGHVPESAFKAKIAWCQNYPWKSLKWPSTSLDLGLSKFKRQELMSFFSPEHWRLRSHSKEQRTAETMKVFPFLIHVLDSCPLGNSPPSLLSCLSLHNMCSWS